MAMTSLTKKTLVNTCSKGFLAPTYDSFSYNIVKQTGHENSSTEEYIGIHCLDVYQQILRTKTKRNVQQSESRIFLNLEKRKTSDHYLE